jgi:hypothetical protein
MAEARRKDAGGRRRSRHTRPHELRVERIELVPATGAAGREIEARQNLAIKEIVLWLQRQGHATDK